MKAAKSTARTWIRVGAISGMLGFLVFVLTVATAISLFAGYNILLQWFSELGASGLAGMVFNGGLILTGILFVVFFFGLSEYFRTFLSKEKEPFIAQAGIALGLASGVSLLGIGLFPITTTVHIIPASAFFILAGLSVLLLSVYFYSIKKDIVLVLPGIAVVVIDAIFILYAIPVMQKIAVFAIAFWFLAMAARMLLDTE